MVLNDTFGESFTFIDIETPNSNNDKICAIGMIHINNGIKEKENYYLVNPETRFDDSNIKIHNITPEEVRNAPTFNTFWNEIEQYFVSSIIVAHNATFDLNVLCKTLQFYEIPIPQLYYICTLEKSHKHNRIANHSLSSLCDFYGIDLQHHHNAMEDTLACMELFKEMNITYGFSSEDIKTYIFNGIIKANEGILSKAVNELYGIIYGIGIDNLINKAEYASLEKWMKDYYQYKGQERFNEYYAILSQVLEDKNISQDEYDQLLKITYINSAIKTFSSLTLKMQILFGIIKGIEIDHSINDIEAKKLMEWMEEHNELKGNYPYDKLFEMLERILEDGRVDKDEEQNLLALLNDFINPGKENTDTSNIEFKDKVFCLTGTFIKGTKEDIEKIINSRGGSCVPGLNKTVNYLIVGGEGSNNWAYGNFGGKIKKALEMKDKGIMIEIIGEASLCFY